jgi:putative membrane protein
MARISWVGALGCVLALAGCRNRKPAPQVATPPAVEDNREAAVLEALHQEDRREIAIAQMAPERAGSQAVKELAAMLVRDHQDIDEKIVDYATAKKVNLVPDTPEAQATEREGSQTLDKLHALEGAELDRAFATVMIIDHQKGINLVKEAQQSVEDPRFKELLSEIEPLLHKHLEAAQQLEAAVASAAPAKESKKVQARRRHGHP